MLRAVIATLCLFLTVNASAQSTILATNRYSPNWGSAGVSGGIPDSSWGKCGSTIAAYGTSGSYASPATINNALSACSANTYVQLGSGTFYLNAGISMVSNVALRGAGANSTIIHFNGGSSCVIGAGNCVVQFSGSGSNQPGNPPYNPAPASVPALQQGSWTGTNGSSGVYTQGATTLNLGFTPSGLTNGTLAILWQADTSTVPTGGNFTNACNSAACAAPPNFAASHAYTLYDIIKPTSGNAGGYFYQVTTAGTSGSAPTWPQTVTNTVTDSGGVVYTNVGNGTQIAIDGSRGTGQQQFVTVTNVSGTTVTVSPGIVGDWWASSRSPQLGWWGSPIVNSGLENLSIIAGSTSLFSVIGFFNALNCWVTGVSTQETGSRDHYLAFQSARLTWANNWLQYACTGGCGGAATGYGFEMWGSSDLLVQNNIIIDNNAPFVGSCCNTGDVFAYNFWACPDSGTYCPSGTTGLDFHEEAAMFNLVEGNIGDTIKADDFHGNGLLNALFRNFMNDTSTAPIDLNSYDRYFNIIGNVLGAAGSTNYACIAPSSTASCGRFNANIYRFGYPDANAGPGPSSNINDDKEVSQTAMLWGNYDTVNAANQFNSSEVPTTDPYYPNSVPGNHTLPNSFYLTATTAASCGTGLTWWKTPATPNCEPFPPIGPDVSGGSVSGYNGRANPNPAEDCYNYWSGVIASFSAAICYLNDPSGPPNTAPAAVVFAQKATGDDGSRLTPTVQ